MYYYYNYDYLKEKIKEHYKETTWLKCLNEFSKDMHRTLFRYRVILENHRDCFAQNEISRASKILNLTDDEIIRCFFTIEKIFMLKEDMIDYLKSLNKE